jgi:uncharacterized protein (DUF58 family)
MADYFDPQTLSRIKGYEMRSLRLVESYMSGMHKSKLLGISTEFAQHRQYVPGDETKHIDWKVFAKTERYYVKEYEAETSMPVVFLLDTSKSMFFQSPPAAMTKFQYAATTVCTLARLLSLQKDAFGLVLFDRAVRTFLPAKGSNVHLRNMTHTLENVSPGEETDLSDVFMAVAPQLKRRSLVIVVSDFVSDLERMALGLGQLSFGNHDVVLFHVEDPQERDFQYRGQTIFLGPENEGRLICEPRDLRNTYLNARARHLTQLREDAMRFGYDVEEMPTDARLDETLSKFLALRQARRKRV